MPKIIDVKLKRHIESEELYPVYVLYGEEKFLLKKGAARLIRKAKGANFPEFNFNEFSDDSSVDSIADAALSLPFMAEKKCVAVYDYNVDALDSSSTSKLQELLENLSESTVLIFVYPTMEITPSKGKWKNFFKLAEKYGASVCYENRTTSEICKLLCDRAEKHGSSLSRKNAEKIMFFAGNDLTLLTNEVDKLSAFAEGREITAEDIDLLVTKKAETRVFELTKAINAGNYDKAYSVLDQLFQMNEEPIGILSILSSSYVNMYRVKAAIQSGLPGSAPAEYDPASYKGREFILSNAERDVRPLSENVLRRSMELLLETDMQLKGSKVSGREALEKLISKLLLITKGERSR